MATRYRAEEDTNSADPIEQTGTGTWEDNDAQTDQDFGTAPSTDAKPAKSQVICVASGKGGTGKTMIAANLAVLLAREGLHTVLVDADFGLANAHLLLGLDPTHDISSVLSGEKKISEITVDGPEGMKLIPGGSGFSELTMLEEEKFLHLIHELKNLEDFADVIIIDLPAGISPQVMCLLSAAHEIIVVTTPEVTSLVDAYALIKSLTGMYEHVAPHIVINRSPDKIRAAVAFQKIFSVTKKHLNGRVSLRFLGWLPQNWYVINSVTSRKPLVLRHPQSFATACVELMAAKVIKRLALWHNKQTAPSASPSYFTKLEQMVYGR